MTDTAAKIRSIFYSAALAGSVMYGLSPNAVLCVNYLPVFLLKLVTIGIFAFITAEYACALASTQDELSSAFEQYYEIYDIEADGNIINSLQTMFNSDDADSILINENLCAKLNGKTYSLSDVDIYCKNSESFSGLVLTAPIEISSKHIIAAGKQNAMSVINIKEYIYSDAKDSFAVFNNKGAANEEIPDEIFKILSELYNETDAESICCSIQNNVMQIAIKTEKSYKYCAKPLYAAMCNLSLRNLDKGAINEGIKTSEKIHEIKKLK